MIEKKYTLRVKKTKDHADFKRLIKLAKKNEVSVNQQILMLIRENVK